MSQHGEVVIVGGGLAGLCAARVLNIAGVSCTVFEADDEVGGRVRSDLHKGFILDRGFQVLLTAYPEATRVLFYDSLGLRPFIPGAQIRLNGRFTTLADPWRRPGMLPASALSPAASIADKLRIARLRRALRRLPVDGLWAAPEVSTVDALRAHGFSDRAIDHFFRPFYGGVFLDRSLRTSRRMFDFTFRMFADGAAALPDAGMGAIPRHLSARLKLTQVRLGTKVARADENGVTLSGGQRIMARAVIVATDQSSAAALLGQPLTRGWCGTTCVYFAATKAPVDEPILVLDGEGRGPVNHLAVPSRVAPSYAPPGAHLISANVVGQPTLSESNLLEAVRRQLGEWFGPAVSGWEHLRTYHIPHALPDQAAPALEPAERPVRLKKGLYIAGDHVDQGSINGAMVSGRRAAEAVLADFNPPAPTP